jgi:hypothetical protein
MQTKINNMIMNKFFFIRLTVYSLLVFFLGACAKIFYAPDAYSRAQKQETVAIVPPTVSIAAGKKIDGEAIKEQQRTESVNFQREMYSWLLKRKKQGKILQEIQEPESTNAILFNAGYPNKAFTPTQLCEILGVDGILSANIQLTKPVSEGAAIALYALFGAYSTTNEIHASLSIHDFAGKKLLWNFDQKFAGTMGSTPAQLVDLMMRKASKKMPYIVSPVY